MAQSQAISYEQGLRFGLVICEALYPDYVKFYNVYHRRNADLLIAAIELCLKAAQYQQDTAAINAMLLAVNGILPHTDDFGSELGSDVLNASAAAYETLQYIISKDPVHLYDIGSITQTQ